MEHVAYIALGSNLGDRAAHIHAALDDLATYARVEATSFLYDTPPAYVLDQPRFLNAACKVRTQIGPRDLLDRLKAAERRLGRIPTVPNSPRTIDLDILFYDDAVVQDGDLAIPHPRLAERDFVLQPMRDLAADLHHPVFDETVEVLLARLSSPPLPWVMPIASHLWTWGARTYVMGILNVTPDSFSGEGLGEGPAMVERALAVAQQQVLDGADCVDVGGQSTRPGHRVIPAEEEIARVVPVIETLAKALPVPVSVDTFRAEVARAALDAGAHLINDVWGLRFDPGVAELAAARHVPLVVMHNQARNDDAAYQARWPEPPSPIPSDADVVEIVRKELSAQLGAAIARGVPRWHLMADPGIGFGKSVAQHLSLIRNLDRLVQMGYPVLFGASRKGFIGKLMGDLPPAERVEGSVAAAVLALTRGAHVLRVHDVRATVRAVRVADAVLASV